jgi:hypothetical protein
MKMKQEFPDDDNYYFELEKDWKKTVSKYSDKELISIFPGVKKIIPQKIKEWKAKLNESEQELKNYLISVYKKGLDEFSVWFWEQVAKTFFMPPIMEAEKHILSLKRTLSIFSPSGKGKKLEEWQEKLEKARQYPIYEIAKDSLSLRPCGDKFSALCPFHDEKRASFYIYPESNSYYCFGCCESGDAIKLTMHLHGVNFKEAVKMLQN